MVAFGACLLRVNATWRKKSVQKWTHCRGIATALQQQIRPSRIALFCIDKRFDGLYSRQRYHSLVHLIPKDYYDSFLADSVWFELTPGQRPEDVEEDPDEDLILSITPDVLRLLQERGFFAEWMTFSAR